jgi:hypothetical protein
MKRLSSVATTRSQAMAMWAPMPAAVPPTAAITGFSQSRMAATSAWAPSRMSLATSPTPRFGASSGRGAGGREARRSAPVQNASPVWPSTTARMPRSALASANRAITRSR